MNNNTLPYTLNPKFFPRYWKTEYTEKYSSKEQHKLVQRQTHNNTQQLIPFFIYKPR
jgi:hypothetical protein